MKNKSSNIFAALLAASGLLVSVAHAADSSQTYQDGNVLNIWNGTDLNWDAGVASWGCEQPRHTFLQKRLPTPAVAWGNLQ